MEQRLDEGRSKAAAVHQLAGRGSLVKQSRRPLSAVGTGKVTPGSQSKKNGRLPLEIRVARFGKEWAGIAGRMIMKFSTKKQDYNNSVTIDWLRLSISIRLFDVFASWLGIPTDPAEWNQLKRFNKEHGVYLMDGVSVWADALPDVGEDGTPPCLNWTSMGDKRFIVDWSGAGLANWYEEFRDSPLDILRYAREIDNTGQVRVNRLDLAFDDHESWLNLDKIQRYLTKTELTVTRWESFERVSASRIKDQSGSDPMDTGETMYLGSRASNSFARIYDKLLELKSKMNRDERRAAESEDALPDHWIRFELELKRQHAQEVANGLLNASNPADYALGVLRGKIDFKSTTGDNRIRRRSPVRWWDRFTRSCAAVPIRVPRPSLTLERIENWLNRSVAPSLAVYWFAAGGLDHGDRQLKSLISTGAERLDAKKLGLLRDVPLLPLNKLFVNRAGTMAHSS